MSTLSIEKPHNFKRTPKKASGKPNATPRPKVESSAVDAMKPTNPNKTTTKKTSAKSNPTPRSKTAAPITVAAETPPPAPDASPRTKEPEFEGATKQDRVLALLSRAEGASIDEMMQATKWQQHSVRGFLAGTVKKKLSFPLTSSKAAGDIRRYRIETRRGRR